MSADWYPDRGLGTLIAQWREEHPGAVVGTIGNEAHQAGTSDHNPEADGSVDAGDFMPGAGVTQDDLDQLAETLRTHRDPRIAYVIRRQRIFSSTVQPWVWRPYDGDYHSHTHVSVNDRHENDTSLWEGFDMALTADDVKKIVDGLLNRTVGSTSPNWPDKDPRVADLLKQPLGAMQILNGVGDQPGLVAKVDELLARPAAEVDYDRLADAIVRRVLAGAG